MTQVDDKLQTIHCPGCMTTEAIPRRIQMRPDHRFEFVELWALNHSECESYGDVRKASNSIRFRKEATRLLLLKGGKTSFQAV